MGAMALGRPYHLYMDKTPHSKALVIALADGEWTDAEVSDLVRLVKRPGSKEAARESAEKTARDAFLARAEAGQAAKRAAELALTRRVAQAAEARQEADKKREAADEIARRERAATRA